MTSIDRVVAELTGEPPLWWGYTANDGWVVLDREDPRNANDLRHLVRCRDWSEFRVTRQEFSSKRFVGVKNQLQSLPAEQLQEECELLLLFREEFFRRIAAEWKSRVVERVLDRRKARLFGIACCRRIWDLMQEDCRQAVLLAERFAEGEAGEEEVRRVKQELQHRRSLGINPEGGVRLFSLYAATGVLFSDRHCARSDLYSAMVVYHNGKPAGAAAKEAEIQAQTHLLLDFIGNRSRPVSLKPEWLTPGVRGLAESIYRERDFAQMPILGDALEDAGCRNEDLLRHCREQKEHARGCWVLDLLRAVD
jgi:hypothetical protein